MIDLSIFCPAIRIPNWDRMYDSIVQSCKKYSWELVMCGPFELTEYLKTKNNVNMIKDLGSPSRCAQLASFECNGRLLYHVVDDALMLENSIDESIDFYNSICGHKDVVNMRYKEGAGYSGASMPIVYWTAQYHGDLRLAGIPQDSKISLHHLINIEYFRELGGYDCEFEYQNFNLHDIMLRVQADGGKLYDSPIDVTTCNHGQNDHNAIEKAHHEHDLPLFQKIYSNPDALKTRIKIDINNWTQQPSVWTRRFKTIPKNYEDLLK